MLQVEQDSAVTDSTPHLVNIGRLIEVWSLIFDLQRDFIRLIYILISEWSCMKSET